MAQLMCGIENGKRWVAGEVPLKRHLMVELDTRTGKGFQEVLDQMEDAIKWHARKMELPSYGQEDLAQELRAMILDAIPQYDVKMETNLSTFLQSHMRKRIINLYKRETEQRRTPTHQAGRPGKVRCPKCREFSAIDLTTKDLRVCDSCGHTQKPTDETWRAYPLAIPMVSASTAIRPSRRGQDNAAAERAHLQDRVSYSDLGLLGGEHIVSHRTMFERLNTEQSLAHFEPTDRLILSHLLEGYSMQETAQKIDMTFAMVKYKVRKMAGK